MLNRDRPKLGQRRRSPQATCFSALELRRYRTFPRCFDDHRPLPEKNHRLTSSPPPLSGLREKTSSGGRVGDT
ncbi:expressed unknown protein [Ectocarpus siliculosus]|uniref:Uncharacterized protein n=1 Tax=Ectocarpus siliculosus TaxID=2880 RepID=D7G510_ECTSI|nr:expressed unknown protein [Ectocarpus siliculosus]|eukprot:CBJ33773.1 expressed unknown protein [Ectocarpus siliculosus]